MKQIHQSLLLAAAMIGVGLLAIFDIVPEKVAQFAPLALLALFPGAWLGRDRCCNILRRGKA
tara:strand:- start:602 stop:787 length:186 start_codon:yes stop_codon:yes gene_type:complete